MAVSQFTLYGFLKGNKPDFHVAMPPQKAEPVYASLVDRFKKSYSSDAIKGMVLVGSLVTLLTFYTGKAYYMRLCLRIAGSSSKHYISAI